MANRSTDLAIREDYLTRERTVSVVTRRVSGRLQKLRGAATLGEKLQPERRSVEQSSLRRDQLPARTSPNGSKLVPLNLRSCICWTGRKSVALVFISMPSISTGDLACCRLGGSFLVFAPDRSVPAAVGTRT